jgi:hypothetical protein
MKNRAALRLLMQQLASILQLNCFREFSGANQSHFGLAVPAGRSGG